ncbi:MAG TPA: Fic family protein [Mucilaginibacter sp.]|jgi:Fic family protein|nr:Fic family protein [Mucilaginibacter sp.]
MDFKLETEFSKTDILTEVDALKKQIDDLRPLHEDVEGKVMQKLRLEWNYHSNAIEGNRLNYGETVAFLMEGITAKGKPLKDHLDIRGHNEAINFLLSIVKDTRPLSEADIRNLHKMILVETYDVKAKTADGLPTTKRITLGEYKVLPNHVKTSTGEIHYYSSPEETPAKMQELMEWYAEAVQIKTVHPVVIAALFHHKFVEIHPFDDGNGRMSRILMNLIIMQHGYTPTIIKNDDRQNYYALLSRADNGDAWPFVEYIAERLISSLQLYLKAANGGDIDEDEDLDKEIALFKMELQDEVKIKEKRSRNNSKFILDTEIDKLIVAIDVKSKEFEEFFFGKKINFDAFFYNSSIGAGYSNYYTHKLKFLFKKIEDEKLDLKQINFKFSFSEFKNPSNNFNVEVNLSIYFNTYTYEIFSKPETILISKYYHEKINSYETSIILKTVITKLRDLIKEKLKSPKSN